MLGNDGFFSSNKENTPPSVKYRQKKKYGPKDLVWVAVSEDCHADPFFRTGGMSINGEVYREKCIRARLKPSIIEVHSEDEIMFWPNLAAAHYAHATTALYEGLEIPFLPRDGNPPNVPQLWPIEHFWGLLKQRVYKDCWKAKTAHQLTLRVKKCLGEMDWSLVQSAM